MGRRTLQNSKKIKGGGEEQEKQMADKGHSPEK